MGYNARDSDSDDLPGDLAGAHERIEQLRAKLDAERARRIGAAADAHCFRELAEHIDEVFWMTNPLGDELVYVSPAYARIWGQSCQSLYEDPGRRLAWVHAADREDVRVAFKRDAPAGRFYAVYRIVRPDGGLRWIRDRAFPVYDDAGQIYRIAGYAIDITQQVQASDRLDALQTDIQARDRMSVFAALGTGLAHDVAQPLTAARNYIASAARADAGAGSALQDADREIEHAIAAIRRLRHFARAGRPSPTRQRLMPLLEDVFLTLDPALRARGIRYHGPDRQAFAELEIPLDRIFAQQILRNLLKNAIDAFADDHDARREIRLDLFADAGDCVEIVVSDTGAGVEHGIDVFEPFVTTKAHGLGLGLAISRTLARGHGGELSLVSRGGPESSQPTRFVLRLPPALEANAAGA